jgi:ribonuclease J
MTDTLRIIPLGGAGEVGKNMTVVEFEETAIAIDCGLMFPQSDKETAIAIDCGLMFPQSDMLGIDLVVPDISYLMEAPDYLKGIFFTHGHEDHIGALPYVLRQLQAPLYATRLTRGLIEVKLREARLLDATEIHTMAPGDRVQVGPFTVESFHVCHSIPDSVGLGGPGHRHPSWTGGSHWGV